jgi:hypothetical protein
LCHRCNRALPNWITVSWLLRAALYLCKGSFGTFRDAVEAELEHRKAEAGYLKARS